MLFGNHLLSNFISRINYGSIKRLRFIKIEYNDTFLKLLDILYKNGAIRSYHIKDNKISVYYKYYLGNIGVKIKLISTPGNRKYLTLRKLSLNYNNNSFSGFYIISTQKGLLTSDDCLLMGLSGGEILLKVIV
jgi:ribosomal protein S8